MACQLSFFKLVIMLSIHKMNAFNCQLSLIDLLTWAPSCLVYSNCHNSSGRTVINQPRADKIPLRRVQQGMQVESKKPQPAMIVINGFTQHVWEYQTQHMTTWRIHQCHGTVQTATDQITQLYRTQWRRKELLKVHERGFLGFPSKVQEYRNFEKFDIQIYRQQEIAECLC